jgi:hypothetical protein
MKPEEIKKLFPMLLKVTQNHRDLAENMGGPHYLGNVLIKEIFPEEDLFWGLSIGNIGSVLIKSVFIQDNKKLPLYLDSNFKGDEILFEIRQK